MNDQLVVGGAADIELDPVGSLLACETKGRRRVLPGLR